MNFLLNMLLPLLVLLLSLPCLRVCLWGREGHAGCWLDDGCQGDNVDVLNDACSVTMVIMITKLLSSLMSVWEVQKNSSLVFYHVFTWPHIALSVYHIATTSTPGVVSYIELRRNEIDTLPYHVNMNGLMLLPTPHDDDAVWLCDDDGWLDDGVQTQKESERPASVADDPDGHLIYKPGDVLQARCTYLQPCVMFSLPPSHVSILHISPHLYMAPHFEFPALFSISRSLSFQHTRKWPSFHRHSRHFSS